MKVLLAHNFYRSSAPSGEDSVYRNEKRMLKNMLDVVCYERQNDNIDDSSFHKKIKLGLDGAWSKHTYHDLTQLIHKSQPDVAHFHNTFPQISSSAYAACQDSGVPVVQTLHNFRFICPNALLLREGRPCEDCLNNSLIHSLRHRCYRDSVLATSAQVWTIASNRWRGTYINNVNRYIALTSFAADKFASAGIPESRIEIKPNFLPEVPDVGKGEGGYALYVGRLSEEKGVKTLIEAWQRLPDLRLKILGDGPLKQELEATANQLKLSIEFLGYCTKKQIIKTVSGAVFQIIPSIWYEGFPMVALEAYACGTPLVVSRIGSLDEIVIEGETGFKFQPGNAADLLETIAKLLSDDGKLSLMRNKARGLFKECYTTESNFRQLITIYQNAILDFNDTKVSRTI